MISGMNVLVVDADSRVQRTFEHYFLEQNCSVQCASNSREALEFAIETVPDLVLTDFMLGEKSCIELILMLRKLNPDVAIAVMTAYPDYITEKDVKAFGADYFLEKPIRSGKLYDLLLDMATVA